MEPAKYTTKTIVLHNDVWAALERLRKVHGSYNKALRELLLKPKRKEKL
jgi:predicted CopG family antitoxin